LVARVADGLRDGRLIQLERLFVAESEEVLDDGLGLLLATPESHLGRRGGVLALEQKQSLNQSQPFLRSWRV